METLDEYIERQFKGIIEPMFRASAEAHFRYGVKWQEKHTEEILRRFIQSERLQFKQKQGDLSIKELIIELEK